MQEMKIQSLRRGTRLIVLCAAALASCLWASGCSKSSTAATAGTPVTANVKITSEATSVSMLFMDPASALMQPGVDALEALAQPHALSTAGGAAAGTGGLTSLKYYIESIIICQSLTTSGSGFSDQTGCSTLYTGATESVLNPTSGQTLPPDYATQSTHAAGVTTGYIDLMSDTDRAKIAASSGSVAAGSYNWGLVNWAYPIKVTATIPVAGLYTQAATVTNTSGPGRRSPGDDDLVHGDRARGRGDRADSGTAARG